MTENTNWATTVTTTKLFAQEVWDTLSKADTAEHEKALPSSGNRPAIGYLPWHKAWMLLKREFPASTYRHNPDLVYKAGSVEVEVMVFIRKEIGGEIMETNARLAVMDNRFNAILDPQSREVNDARQRCLVKALAFAGLGLHLWSESPLPVGRFEDPISKKQLEKLEKLIEDTDTNLEYFEEWCGCKVAELPVERFPSAMNLLSAKVAK